MTLTVENLAPYVNPRQVIRDVERYRENAEIEANILLDLRVADPENVSNCLRLYNAFLHNDAYYCLVCELLGESLYDFLKLNGYRGYWLQVRSCAVEVG